MTEIKSLTLTYIIMHTMKI